VALQTSQARLPLEQAPLRVLQQVSVYVAVPARALRIEGLRIPGPPSHFHQSSRRLR
jgi:hypothetical protein